MTIDNYPLESYSFLVPKQTDNCEPEYIRTAGVIKGKLSSIVKTDEEEHF